ncbi:phosphatase PAP2 family protein [Mucilaginibacter glaciei]|uniref:Phosphatase PAP2 family protein n=1 Tax=Mucilaginibacter glaciei TaxID=2772109 RepID=A0A926S1X7_9SPHI|nr:phosphatase PAP2 family protein [Mucilaginibacter glaciei]MBD1392619.1 phosphatase PAP2 family protein [Mucilaginibacter glaciei]
MTKRRQQIIILLLSVITVGFVVLTMLVHFFPQSALDVKFSKEIQEHQNPFFDRVMYLISAPGYFPESLIMIVLTSLILFVFKFKKASVYALLTMLAGLVSTVVKALVNRPRPSDTLVRIVYKTTQQSFPSGHVLFYVVYFGFLVLLMVQLEHINKAIRLIVGGISLFMIFTIPISRIYLGAHWFTDVLGGFLLGVLCLALLSWFYLRKKADSEEAPIPERQ